MSWSLLIGCCCVWAGDQSTGVMLAPKLTATEVGNRPFSIGLNCLGDSTDKTESYRTAFGADFGNPFTGKTYTPNDAGDADRPLSSKTETNVTRTLAPDDTEVGDQPFSSDSDHLRETESHQTELCI